MMVASRKQCVIVAAIAALEILVGCKGDETPPNGDPPPPPACTTASESVCVDGEVRYCLVEEGAFGPAESCPADQICKATACEAVPATLVAQASYIEQYVADRQKFDINPETDVNYAYLASRAKRHFFLSDGSVYAFISSIYEAALAIPNGHTLFGVGPTNFASCFDRSVADIGFTTYSFYGACTRPYKNGAAVTYVADEGGNPLGLAKGDWIYGLKRGAAAPATGDALVELLRKSPKCGSITPSLEASQALALSDMFAVALPGDILLVQSSDGEQREVTLGAPMGEALNCRDPFARSEAGSMFDVSQRPDGVVVLLLPTLGNHPAHPFPANMTLSTYREWIVERRDLIADAISAFSNITGLVIDVRGNGGGSQELGMTLVAALPNTVAGAGICRIRVPESSPAEFTDAGAYLLPYEELTGDNMPEPLGAILPDGTKIAVVIDHGAYSAADWLAYYAQQNGISLVGTPHAGAFGFSGGAQHVRRNILAADGAPVNILSRIAGAKCYDAAGVAMEGLSSVDEFVELSPTDLAMGRDSQIEAAVAKVLAAP